jgi:hypothetical protein
VAELEDANILAGVDEAERVKLADMDANVAVYVLVGANDQRVLVALGNDSVALKNVADVDADAK